MWLNIYLWYDYPVKMIVTAACVYCNTGTLLLCPPTMSLSQGPLCTAAGPALLPQQLARANRPITELLAQPTRDLPPLLY